MNRILVFLKPDGETSVECRRKQLKKSLAHIEETTDGIVDIFITHECVPVFSINHKVNDDCYDVELPSVEQAESFIAAELRRFAGLCIETATKLEGEQNS
ncbi:MAG TPA: hypothetical protein VNQ76_01885 [Planctomicrobium sp.]|nr:hypothetical protein [Planctomicrobium sp.]